jgi:hypothetical protein
MRKDSVDWTDLHDFHAVDLTQSFVLSWTFSHDALLIDVDLCLSPDHPLYEKPRPAEGACFRPALLEFPNCTRVAEKEAAATTPACAEIVAGLTHGLISSLSLVTDGEYALSGDFGTLQILADRPILRLDPRRSGPARS